MFIYPVPQGTWSIEISCEGYQATSSTTDPHRGKSDGMIAYDDNQDKVWNIGVQNNVTISNNKADADWKYGHPDLTINGERFDQKQVVEKDGTVSFHLVTTGPNASFFLAGPAVKKTAKYNFCISYGAWTDRDMEFGLVSVVLDEHLEGVRGSQYVRKTLRPGHVSVNRTHRLQDSFTPVEYVSDEDSSSSSSSIVSNRPSTPDNDSDVQFTESLKGKLPTQSKLPPKGFLSRLSAKEKEEISSSKPSNVERQVGPLVAAYGYPSQTGVYDAAREILQAKEAAENLAELERDLKEINKLEPPDTIVQEEIPDFVPPPERVIQENDPDYIPPIWRNADQAVTIATSGQIDWSRPTYESGDPPKKARTLKGTLSKLGGSLRSGESSLRGNLRKTQDQTDLDNKLSKLSVIQRSQYQRILNNLGKMRARAYIDGLDLD
jgi:hypothetical protein